MHDISQIREFLYGSLAKMDPWAVHLTLDPDWGMGQVSLSQLSIVVWENFGVKKFLDVQWCLKIKYLNVFYSEIFTVRKNAQTPASARRTQPV